MCQTLYLTICESKKKVDLHHTTESEKFWINQMKIALKVNILKKIFSKI